MVPPLPIPNREVKHSRADGTAHPRESRSPPFFTKSPEFALNLGLFFLLTDFFGYNVPMGFFLIDYFGFIVPIEFLNVTTDFLNVSR